MKLLPCVIKTFLVVVVALAFRFLKLQVGLEGYAAREETPKQLLFIALFRILERRVDDKTCCFRDAGRERRCCSVKRFSGCRAAIW